jgi:hypothetical protein
VPTDYVSKDYSVLPPVGQKVTYSSAGSLRSSPDYSPLIPLADAAFLLPRTELQGSDTVRRVCETVTGGMLVCVSTGPNQVPWPRSSASMLFANELDARVKYLGRRLE